MIGGFDEVEVAVDGQGLGPGLLEGVTPEGGEEVSDKMALMLGGGSGEAVEEGFESHAEFGELAGDGGTNDGGFVVEEAQDVRQVFDIVGVYGHMYCLRCRRDAVKWHFLVLEWRPQGCMNGFSGGC